MHCRIPRGPGVRFDLRSLELLQEVAEHGSLTKAAQASNIALAAVSRRLALLEEKAGIRLLSRTSAGVELTPAGSAALFYIRKILNDIHEMQVELLDYAKGMKGLVRLQAHTSAIVQYTAQDLRDFNLLHPDIRINLQERASHEIVDAVRDGSTDIGIVVEGGQRHALTHYDYRRDHLAAVTPPNLKLPSKVSWSELVDFDLVILEGGSAIGRLLAQKAAELKRALRVRVQVKSIEAVCRMVQAGLGLGILPQGAVQELAKAMHLRVVPLADQWADRKLLICVRDPKALPFGARQLIEHLRANSEPVSRLARERDDGRQAHEVQGVCGEALPANP